MSFNGNNEHLVLCINALLNLDKENALVPHGVGGHARSLLEACAERLSFQPQTYNTKNEDVNELLQLTGEMNKSSQEGIHNPDLCIQWYEIAQKIAGKMDK